MAPAGKTPETGTDPCGGLATSPPHPLGCRSDALSGHSRRRTGRLNRAGTYSSVNMGSPKVREGYGDGVPVVVGGVTPAQSGDRENRTTGRRGTGDERVVTMKDAQCKRLKWC